MVNRWDEITLWGSGYIFIQGCKWVDVTSSQKLPCVAINSQCHVVKSCDYYKLLVSWLRDSVVGGWPNCWQRYFPAPTVIPLGTTSFILLMSKG
jgi:hypothetical protein